MQYKTIDEQEKEAIAILKKNTELMEVLNFVSKLNLPNFYIGAGSVFQTIWNYYDGKTLNHGIKDIDVIYYNKDDLNPETDKKYCEKINEYCIKKGLDFEIDVSNEARMHLWKKAHFNIDTEQYKNTEDAINQWIATIHAIGITKDDRKIKIYAPFGLSDIYSRTLRPIKHKYNTKEMYDNKVKSWNARFDNLKIIEW